LVEKTNHSPKEEATVQLGATFLFRPPVSAERYVFWPPFIWEISEAIEKRQLVHENEVFAESPRGREVLSLRLEKENLLDTVWLAISPKQIKDLWQKIDDLLGGEQTALQKEALAIEPLDPS